MELTFNEEMIIKYAEEYKAFYFKKYRNKPTSWFGYLKWLASFTPAGCFNHHESELAKIKLNIN